MLLSRLGRFFLYFLICWSPLPLASNRPAFWVFNGVLAVIAAAFFLVGEWRRDSTASRFDWAPIAAPSLCIAVVVVWMVVQTIPGMPAGIRHPAWDALGAAADRYGTISVDPSATWTTIAEILPIALLAIMAARISVIRRRAHLILNLVVCTTTAVAVYGIIGEAVGFHQAFLVEDVAYPGAVTGTFIGRNAAATYFVIGIACSSALIATGAEQLMANSASDTNRWLVFANLLRTTGVYLAADIILAAALLNTGSRGGTIAGGVALLSIALIALGRAGGQRRAVAATLVGVLGAVFVVVAISSDFLLNRLSGGVDSGQRLAVYADTLDMIKARPLLGHGGGTYADAFPLYHLRAPTGFLWNRAHDTYLQAATELGLPVFAILILAFGLVVVPIVRGLFAKDGSRPAGIAAIGVTAAVAFHSVVDFSLQVQTVGMTAAVVVAAGLGETLFRRSASRAEPVSADAALPAGTRQTISVTIPLRQR